MNMYFFFEKLNILCIFRNRFFDPVLFPVPVFFGVNRFGSCNTVPKAYNHLIVNYIYFLKKTSFMLSLQNIK
jgi:hypothetical protein